MEVEWITTENGVFAAIYAVHHESLYVFSSHTCIEGCEFHSGNGQILTTWAFKGASVPIIRSIEIVRDGDPNKREYSYWIAKVKAQGEE